MGKILKDQRLVVIITEAEDTEEEVTSKKVSLRVDYQVQSDDLVDARTVYFTPTETQLKAAKDLLSAGVKAAKEHEHISLAG